MNKTTTISTAKADRLYWLGRYTERTYLSLHLLRYYYDKMIDGKENAYEEYCKKLSLPVTDGTADGFIQTYLYDAKNPFSILSELEMANDNAIVLREEITSETLAYLQMSIAKIKALAKSGEKNITALQSITDNLLSLWGSAAERILNDSILSIIDAGREVEYMDMHLRFDYPYERIAAIYDRLKKNMDEVPDIWDEDVVYALDDLITERMYNHSAEYKNEVLSLLSKVFMCD